MLKIIFITLFFLPLFSRADKGDVDTTRILAAIGDIKGEINKDWNSHLLDAVKKLETAEADKIEVNRSLWSQLMNKGTWTADGLTEQVNMRVLAAYSLASRLKQQADRDKAVTDIRNFVSSTNLFKLYSIQNASFARKCSHAPCGYASDSTMEVLGADKILAQEFANLHPAPVELPDGKFSKNSVLRRIDRDGTPSEQFFDWPKLADEVVQRRTVDEVKVDGGTVKVVYEAGMVEGTLDGDPDEKLRLAYAKVYGGNARQVNGTFPGGTDPGSVNGPKQRQ